jgi:hypothetical protein
LCATSGQVLSVSSSKKRKNEISEPESASPVVAATQSEKKPKKRESSALVAEIGDGVDRRQQPERGRERDEEKRDLVDAQEQDQAGGERQRRLVDRAAGDGDEHRHDQRQLQHRAAQVQRVAQKVAFLRQEEGDDRGHERGHQDEDGQGGGHSPSSAASGRPICMNSKGAAEKTPRRIEAPASTSGTACAARATGRGAMRLSRAKRTAMGR